MQNYTIGITLWIPIWFRNAAFWYDTKYGTLLRLFFLFRYNWQRVPPAWCFSYRKKTRSEWKSVSRHREKIWIPTAGSCLHEKLNQFRLNYFFNNVGIKRMPPWFIFAVGNSRYSHDTHISGYIRTLCAHYRLLVIVCSAHCTYKWLC